MKKYKVINESEQYSLQVYSNNHKDSLPSKYWIGHEKFYPALKNGDIGTIDFEFNHPNGIRLAIFKVEGFDDKFKVIARNALGNLDDAELPMPKIEWFNFPDNTDKSEVELKGKIVANGNITKFTINQDQPNLNDNKEFVYTYKMKPGRNAFSYFISTSIKTETFGHLVIENTSNIHEDIYKLLLENSFLKLSNDSVIRAKEVQQIMSGLKEGYFYPLHNFTYYYVEANNLVEDDFRHYLTEISEGLKKRGCKALIGKEIRSFNSKRLSLSGEQYFTHSIEFNGKKEIIFEGFLKEAKPGDIYLKKIIDLLSKSLSNGKREEKIKLISSYDGVLICLLSDREFEILANICKPLKSIFIK